MAKQYLDKSGLTYFWGKVKEWVQNYAKITTSEGVSTITIGSTTLTPVLKDGDKVLSDNNFTNALKTKLDGIATGAEVNQNAFSTIKVGETSIAADSKTDTLEIAAASNSLISVTGDATNDKVTIDVDKDLSKYNNTTSGFITSASIPVATTTTPKMSGTAAVGTETKWAKGDHVHPSDTTKANKNELTITAGTTADKKTIQLKSGTSQEVLIAHQDISGKADKSSTVSSVDYDTTLKKITKTIDGTTTDVVTVATIKTDLSLTKSDVGLGNVDNKSEATIKTDFTGSIANNNTGFVTGGAAYTALANKADKSELTITAGTTTDKKTIQLKSGTSQEVLIAHQDISGKVNNTTTVNGHALSSNVTVTKSDVGLGNVTNDAQIPLSQKGAASGVCPLDANSKIASQYLPSYVDDVIEAYARANQTALSSTWLATGSASGTVITPEAGKIYVLMANSGDYSANSEFRWGGSEYVQLFDGGVSSISDSEIDAIVV